MATGREGRELMGMTIDLATGRQSITCDSCGREITGGKVHVDPPDGVRGWTRYSHLSPEMCERPSDA